MGLRCGDVPKGPLSSLYPIRLSLEEGTSKMLGIYLKEKNQWQSSGTGKSTIAAQHHSESFLKVTNECFCWNPVVKFTHSCLVEASPLPSPSSMNCDCPVHQQAIPAAITLHSSFPWREARIAVTLKNRSLLNKHIWSLVNTAWNANP